MKNIAENLTAAFAKTVLIFLTAMSFSCSKSKDSTCYECKALIEKKEGQVLVNSSGSTETFCDKSESDIKTLEGKNNYTETKNGITTESTFKCILK